MRKKFKCDVPVGFHMFLEQQCAGKFGEKKSTGLEFTYFNGKQGQGKGELKIKAQ